MLALLISMISYAVFVFVAGASALRDASGDITEFYNGTYTNCTGRECDFGMSNSYTVSSQIVTEE